MTTFVHKLLKFALHLKRRASNKLEPYKSKSEQLIN